MKPSFFLRGPDSPFGDPCLYLRFRHSGRAVLFDLGDLPSLSPKDLLHVGDVFVSHAHMDHFAGFDRLLRLNLHREHVLTLCGPAGFIDRVNGRLNGFTWNLTDAYPLSVVAMEKDGAAVRKARFRAARAFAREDLPGEGWTGKFLDEGRFAVHACELDHGTPCMGFRMEERARINVLTGELERAGLSPGPWLTSLKEDIWRGEPPSRRVHALGISGPVNLSLGDLAGIYEIGKGAVVAYVVDAADTQPNRERIVKLAQKADLLYIEAAFAGRDRGLARERSHLTAGAAGEMAAAAGVGRMRLVHLSPRYTGFEDEILREAREAAGPDVTVEPGWRREPR